MVLLKGFIYKIFSERFKDEIVYIGQTRQDLQVRWNKHKRDAREFELNQMPSKSEGKEAKLHRSIRLLGEDNCKIIKLEEFEFEDKNELLNKLDERENFFIKKFNSIDQGWNKQYAPKTERQIGQQYDKTWQTIALEHGVNVRRLWHQVHTKKISIDEAVKNIKELDKNPKIIYFYAQQNHSLIRDLEKYDKHHVGKDLIESRIRSELQNFNLMTKLNDVTNTKTVYLKDFIFRSKRINPEYIVKTAKGEFRGSIVSLHEKLFGLFPEIVPPLDKYTTVQGRLRKGYTPEQAFGFRLPPFLVEIEFLINEKNYNWGEIDGEVYIPDLKRLKARPKYIILHSLKVIYLYQNDWINAYKLSDGKKVIKLLSEHYSPEDVLKEFGRNP